VVSQKLSCHLDPFEYLRVNSGKDLYIILKS
jgi:hypothetical protein